MMPVKMDERFTAALRELLVEQAQTTTPQRWLTGPKRWLAALGTLFTIVACGGGLSFALGVWNVTPGSPVATALAPAIAVTGSGTQTVRLGAQPKGTNSIKVRFACLSDGTFTFSHHWGSETCTGKVGARVTAKNLSAGLIAVKPGQNSITVTTAPGDRWYLKVAYTHFIITPWGVNASGQTYGTGNSGPSSLSGRARFPDLTAVRATNGRQGYAYTKQLNGPTPKNPQQAGAWQRKQEHEPPRYITVYESNGTTPIGRFKVDEGTKGSQP